MPSPNYTRRACRICGGTEHPDRLVKYNVRHYAHYQCYLEAGKRLEDLHAWQVGNFPFRLLKERGLAETAEKIIADDVMERVHRMGER